MKIKYTCPKCGCSYTFDGKAILNTTFCPECRTIMKEEEIKMTDNKQEESLYLSSVNADNLTYARFITHNGKQYNVDDLISLADRAEKYKEAVDKALLTINVAEGNSKEQNIKKYLSEKFIEITEILEKE